MTYFVGCNVKGLTNTILPFVACQAYVDDIEVFVFIAEVVSGMSASIGATMQNYAQAWVASDSTIVLPGLYPYFYLYYSRPFHRGIHIIIMVDDNGVVVILSCQKQLMFMPLFSP